MTLPTTDTIVSYSDGDLSNTATVLHSEQTSDGRWAIILDETSCHPVDIGWPDQAADRAALRRANGDVVEVSDAIVSATDGSALFIGSDIPQRPGTDGWAYVVVHLTDTAIPDGESVTVEVDGDHRRALSTGHTACHLASLALNRAMTDRWSKEVREDGLGQPDFDGAAIERSTIREDGSTDVFRLNKSLRRKGFSTDGLAEDLPAIVDAIDATLAGWLATAAPVHVDRDGPGLTDRRYWVCQLPEASVRIACGGTHVTSLAELGTLSVSLDLTDDAGTPTLTMTTDAR